MIPSSNTLLQEYLQRERHGCARLENFASGLELIGQKALPSENPFILNVFVFAETIMTGHSYMFAAPNEYTAEPL